MTHNVLQALGITNWQLRVEKKKQYLVSRVANTLFIMCEDKQEAQELFNKIVQAYTVQIKTKDTEASLLMTAEQFSDLTMDVKNTSCFLFGAEPLPATFNQHIEVVNFPSMQTLLNEPEQKKNVWMTMKKVANKTLDKHS